MSGKTNVIRTILIFFRSSLSSLHSFSTPSPKDDPLKSPDFPPDEDDGQESSYLSYHPRPAAVSFTCKLKMKMCIQGSINQNYLCIYMYVLSKRE